MSRFWWMTAAFLVCSASLWGGQADGVYKEAAGEFKIGYAVADRDAESGEVRILLASQAPPESADWERSLDRLETLGDACGGGYIVIEPTSDGENFNVTLKIDALGFGGGGQYPSKIEIGAEGVKGKIEAEVMSGRMDATFETDYLPARKKVSELPPDGGEPGAALLAQLEAVASGDREAILRTLTADQRAQFEQLSKEEQDEALSGAAEFAPQNVRITGGVLYEGYAIVEFEAESFGEQARGRALLSPDGDQWRVREVSTSVG